MIIDTIIGAAIVGVGTGIGTGVGTYFSNRLVVKHLEKIEEKLKVKK